MKRIAFALGLAALFASTSASAIKVPTGNTDYDLNVSVLLQARYEGTFEGSARKNFDSDFFGRRARLAAGGTAFKVFSFFIQYDNSNLGKRSGNGLANITTTGNPGFVQDLILGWTPIPDFTIEGGLILAPSLRTMAYSSSGGQVQIEAPIDFQINNLDRGLRMTGFQLRGFLASRFIHYRLGVYDGFHSTAAVNAVAANPATATPAVAAAPAVNPGGKPLVGGHVRINFIGDETGYGFNQMYLDGKTRASIGGVFQYQPQAACIGVATACSLASGAGATAKVNDYKMYGGDAFLDTALPGNMELSLSASIIRWDYGSNAGATGFQRTGLGYTGEVDLRFGPIAPYIAGSQYVADSGTTNKTVDRRRLTAGLAFFLKGQQDKIGIEFDSIVPGAPGNPGSIAPVASAIGLRGPTTNAIWVQGQAAF